MLSSTKSVLRVAATVFQRGLTLRLSDRLSASAPSDLSSLQVSQQAAKCIPAMVCPELTEQIRREVAASLHQRKGDFTCYFLTDLVTFTLPAGQKRSHCLPHWSKIKGLLFVSSRSKVEARSLTHAEYLSPPRWRDFNSFIITF